ncbi:MAG: glycosyltransferase family 2 protein [Chlorobium sp.]|uniref:glycosyltransferase family 2 protein n=1 Tax=Chlorobium sp. TaxID=1095 RepID=UPI0025BC6D0A|nr:glycosyltransferase family 2 protein [Chlorobium sp.]MCF8382816.1 glycosyltransferase family 2 protein [Chlorobium sp.]
MNGCIIIIPCYNGERRLGRVLHECGLLDADIVVIDDGSTDDSRRICMLHGVRVHSIDRNSGVGHALQAGFRIARENGYQTVVTLDADGAHDPKDIPGMIEWKMKNNVDMVIGNRWHGDAFSGIPSCKLSANRFAAALMKIAAGITLPDVACGLRVFDVSITERFGDTTGFGFLYEMIFCVLQQGSIGSCPVNVRYDASDLWFTKKGELLDLIGICEKWCPDVAVLTKLRQIGAMVKGLERFAVCFSHDSRVKEMYVVHPLVANDGFVFQEQHASFYDGFDHVLCFEHGSCAS